MCKGLRNAWTSHGSSSMPRMTSRGAAETLSAYSGTAELVEAEGGYTFGGAHPVDGTIPESLGSVWETSIDFF